VSGWPWWIRQSHAAVTAEERFGAVGKLHLRVRVQVHTDGGRVVDTDPDLQVGLPGKRARGVQRCGLVVERYRRDHLNTGGGGVVVAVGVRLVGGSYRRRQRYHVAHRARLNDGDDVDFLGQAGANRAHVPVARQRIVRSSRRAV